MVVEKLAQPAGRIRDDAGVHARIPAARPRFSTVRPIAVDRAAISADLQGSSGTPAPNAEGGSPMSLPPIARYLGRVIATVVLVVACVPDLGAAQTADAVTQARQALAADQVDEAIVILERAVNAAPDDPDALAWLGSAQVRKARAVSMFEAPGWVKTGFDTMDQAVRRFPTAFVVYMVRGITATRVPDFFGKTAGAIQDLSTVVTMKEKDPASVPDAAMPLVYLHLGRAYEKNDQTTEARAAWEKGKRLFPAAAEAQAIDRELQRLEPTRKEARP
jgi:tetratricopeptide (TPR) repeat protein